ncbi:hypothetical protein [Planctomyces sp. SH-PL62]|uniref:hypothetical protein n=1 Tax=Planctomyces sp. SH-PL62 TaxID=1636152 RepID=UPI00078BA7F8|nr:hypothetical protein [Planctomyces sp. SH-PL62]AMV37726.1 hypothetical protein VT85_09840 [Planctomyces sp. SH-PL62]
MTTLIRKSTTLTAVAAAWTFALAALIPPLPAQDAAPGEAQAPKAKAKASRKAESRKAAATADEDEAPKPRSARSTPPDAIRRVPIYFGGLGLTNEQKESIYKIEGKYQPEIQDLEQQADALRERLMADCEDVLTPAQKRALTDARKSAAERRKSASDRRKAEEKPAPETVEADAPASKPATID